MDFQTRQCRHLLASVIQLAVSDACSTPGKEKPSMEALTAMRFIFDESVAGLNEYAELLDINAGQFRKRLLKIMKMHSVGEVNGFSESQRIHFMKNFKYWQLNPLEVRLEIENVDD